jgi:hypothetical protein
LRRLSRFGTKAFHQRIYTYNIEHILIEQLLSDPPAATVVIVHPEVVIEDKDGVNHPNERILTRNNIIINVKIRKTRMFGSNRPVRI